MIGSGPTLHKDFCSFVFDTILCIHVHVCCRCGHIHQEDTLSRRVRDGLSYICFLSQKAVVVEYFTWQELNWEWQWIECLQFTLLWLSVVFLFHGRRQDFEKGSFSQKSLIFTVNFKDFSVKVVVRTPWPASNSAKGFSQREGFFEKLLGVFHILLIWLVKNSDRLWVAIVPCRRGMDFYRVSNSPSWGAAVEGAVCRGWCNIYLKFIGKWCHLF
jgi:hypothetical protein